MPEAGQRFTTRGVGRALVAYGVLALACFLLSPLVPFSVAAMILLCGLTTLAWRATSGAAIPACLIATLSLNIFYTQPKRISHPLSGQEVATLFIFVATVLTVSRVSTKVAAQARELQTREDAQGALQQLAERSIQMDWRESVIDDLSRAVRSCFHFRSVCIWDEARQRLAIDGEINQGSDSLKAALMADKDFDLPKNGTSIRMLRSGVRRIGALQIDGTLPNATTIGAVVSLVSLTMERTHALEKEINARSESISEQLRSSVLDGLAHSIKTPLTTIGISASAVAAVGGLTSVQTRLLHTIEEQTQRITSLTDRLLRTARIDSRMVMKRREADIPALISEALRTCDEPHRFTVDKPPDPFSVFIDPDLLKMAVVQIAENALKYSVPDSTVTIHIALEARDLRIAIHNFGSYVPPAERFLLFKRFYRAQGSEHRAPGTGLGLFVAKHAIDALAGDISLESDPQAGTTFTIQLPV